MNNGRNPQPMNRPTPFRGAQCGIAVTSCVSVVKSPSAVLPRTGLDRDQQREVAHLMRCHDIQEKP